MAILANYGLLGASLNWRGVTVYPAHDHPLGLDMLGHCVKHFGADLVISLYDLWVLPLDTRHLFEPPWIALIPVDGAPASPAIIERAETVDYPVAFSLFGKYQLFDAGIEAEYIPLGVDCEMFKPAEDKAAVRDQLDIPQDTFLVTMVAANKGWPARKAWPEALSAFARFHSNVPRSLLYIHSTRAPYGGRGQGVYLGELTKALDIADAVTFVDQGALAVGIPDEQLAAIYQASDVLLSPSMGEGFGLPIAEAQACGCPVITQDCSSMSELTVNGIATKPLQPMWIPRLGYWWQVPSVERIATALEKVYCWPGRKRARMAREGVQFIRKHYDWSVVMETYWQPFLGRVEAELW